MLLDRLDKKNSRRVFWSLMGSMILATAGAISLAVFEAEDLPAYKDFPLSAFFKKVGGLTRRCKYYTIISEEFEMNGRTE